MNVVAMNRGVTGIFLCAPVLPLLVKNTLGESAVSTPVSPAAAVIEKYLGYINAKDRRGELPYENFAGRFVVQLRKENNRWVMTGYDNRMAPHTDLHQ